MTTNQHTIELEAIKQGQKNYHFTLEEMKNFLRRYLQKDNYGHTIIPSEKDGVWRITIISTEGVELGTTDYIESAGGYFDIITYEEVLKRISEWRDYRFIIINMEVE